MYEKIVQIDVTSVCECFTCSCNGSIWASIPSATPWQLSLEGILWSLHHLPPPDSAPSWTKYCHLTFRKKFQANLTPEHKAIMVDQAKAIAVEGTQSEAWILFLGSPVTELACGDRVLLRINDPQLPGWPVLCLLFVVFHASHLQAG